MKPMDMFFVCVRKFQQLLTPIKQKKAAHYINSTVKDVCSCTEAGNWSIANSRVIAFFMHRLDKDAWLEALTDAKVRVFSSLYMPVDCLHIFC